MSTRRHQAKQANQQQCRRTLGMPQSENGQSVLFVLMVCLERSGANKRFFSIVPWKLLIQPTRNLPPPSKQQTVDTQTGLHHSDNTKRTVEEFALVLWLKCARACVCTFRISQNCCAPTPTGTECESQRSFKTQKLPSKKEQNAFAFQNKNATHKKRVVT